MRKQKAKKEEVSAEELARRDEESGRRISGEPDSDLHSVAVGTIGGAVAGGAIGTAVGGPIGGAIGAAVGGITGGVAADKIQDQFDPNLEDVYWKENFQNRSYYKPGDKYEEYLPAYRLGWEAAIRKEYENREFHEIENELQKEWAQQNNPRDWQLVRDIVRDGFDRVRETWFEKVNDSR